MKIKMVVPALVVLSVSFASVAFASEADWGVSFRAGRNGERNLCLRPTPAARPLP